MDYSKFTLIELVDGIKKGRFSSESVVEFFISKCEEKKDLNAVIEVFDDAIEKARAIDRRIKNGESVGKLAGVPIAIKDNILCKGKKAGCASAFMQNFVSPYSSTIVNKLEQEDAIIFARTNMDEFAMGGSTENTIYGACKNAINPDCVAGGSSGGSAVAVASGMCPCAIGTDTGGSIRQPASFNGVVGIKPTYGTVSRFGIVAYASSFDQASPITRTIEDNEYVLEIMSGKDSNDATTIDNKVQKSELGKKVRLGICKQVNEMAKELKEYPKFLKAVEKFNNNGYEIVDVDIPHIKNCLACYYILSPAEAASNLARFDGVKYTVRSKDAQTIDDVYFMSRSEGFGTEVKRRICLGNFVLSSGYFDAYYNKAKKLQMLIKQEFKKAFENCDAIILPTTPGEAFKIGEKVSDPISMYLEDLFTVPANIAGIPALNVPFGNGETGMPLGLQFLGNEKSESKLYEIAKQFSEFDNGGVN